MERSSGDVCLHTEPGSYMKDTLTILVHCMISVAIGTEMMVKTQIVLCSS
jgi:hypothetical protein